MAVLLLELWCGLPPDDGAVGTQAARRQPGRVHADRLHADRASVHEGDGQDGEAQDRVPDPDAELVARIRAGDADALDRLMRAHTAALARFAYSYVHSRTAAIDIVQDVFVAVWELGDRWQVTGTTRGYLFASVRNRALNVHKHQGRMQRFAEQFETHTPDDLTVPAMGAAPERADERVLLEEQQALLRRAVAELPVRWRQAVMLRVQEQLSYDEIALALGVSAGAARKLVERAQHELRRMLAPYLELRRDI